MDALFRGRAAAATLPVRRRTLLESQAIVAHHGLVSSTKHFEALHDG